MDEVRSTIINNKASHKRSSKARNSEFSKLSKSERSIDKKLGLEETELATHKTMKMNFLSRFSFVKKLCRSKNTPYESYLSPNQIAFVKGHEKFNREFN